MFANILICIFLTKDSFCEVVEVGKPRFKCGENQEIIIKEISGVTEIRLPKNHEALYSVITEKVSDCKQNCCFFISWKTLRDFEIYLNKNFPNTGQNGIIYFDNNMLSPGFNYLLHVILKRSDKRIDNKVYNLTFHKVDNVKTVIHGFLELNSGNKFYSALPVIVNANVTFCGNFESNYYFKWWLIINNKNILLPEKSRELFLISNFSKEVYVILCEVVTINDNVTILTDYKQIFIVEPPETINNNNLQVSLPFKFTTINKRTSINIKPYVINNGDYKIEWACMFENVLLHECERQTNEEFYMESGFVEEGNYTITLTVITIDNLKKIATCNILVLPNVPSIIELYLVYPVKEDNLEINAKIFDLRTYCTVKWHLFENIEFTKNIWSRDKTFLEDIMEFGSLKVTRNFKLKIPRKRWNSLKSGRHKVNLAVACPLMQEIFNKTTIEEQPKNFLTINGQLEFFMPSLANSNIKSLKIFSYNDIALKSDYYYKITKFNNTKESFLYKFGFILEGYEIVFYNAIDVYKAKTVLPFNGDKGIETYVEICNFKNKCAKKFGPLIKTRLTDFNESEIIKIFKQLLIEENFYKIFSYAFIVLHSSSYFNQRDKYKQLFSAELSKKVQNLMGNGSQSVVNNLLTHFNGFSSNLKLNAEFTMLMSQLSREGAIHTRFVREVSENVQNSTLEEYLNITNKYGRSNNLGKRISYVIILSTLIGFVILGYIIKKLTIYEAQPNMALDVLNDNHHYGNIFYDDMLV